MAAVPATARSQRLPVIGYLSSRAPEGDQPYAPGFRDGLKQAGFVDGQNVTIEYRWAHYEYDRLPGLAAELAQRQVDVIFAAPIQAALAAKQATSTIPVVFATGADPVALGLVPSFSRPGANLTGVSFLGGAAVAAKRLELVRDLLPAAKSIAALVNPSSPANQSESAAMADAARLHGLAIDFLEASTDPELEAAFGQLAERQRDALLVATDGFFSNRHRRIVDFASERKLPAVYPWRQYAEAGGLISYGASVADAYRQAALYVGRVLKGEKPAGLPVQEPTKLDLVVNMKTAKALGLQPPLTVLARATDIMD